VGGGERARRGGKMEEGVAWGERGGGGEGGEEGKGRGGVGRESGKTEEGVEERGSVGEDNSGGGSRMRGRGGSRRKGRVDDRKDREEGEGKGGAAEGWGGGRGKWVRGKRKGGGSPSSVGARGRRPDGPLCRRSPTPCPLHKRIQRGWTGLLLFGKEIIGWDAKKRTSRGGGTFTRFSE